MVNTRGIARLGMLAVGLGVGAAVAHTPVASADTSSDWLSSIESLLSGAVPAADPAAVTDFQISFNGTDLFSTVGNEATATTVAGQFGLAIAFGDGATANAEGGIGNYALADGTNALANAGSFYRDRRQLQHRHRHRQQRRPQLPTTAPTTAPTPAAAA